MIAVLSSRLSVMFGLYGNPPMDGPGFPMSHWTAVMMPIVLNPICAIALLVLRDWDVAARYSRAAKSHSLQSAKLFTTVNLISPDQSVKTSCCRVSARMCIAVGAAGV